MNKKIQLRRAAMWMGWVSIAWSGVGMAEEMKKPDFVLPEILIKGQLERSIDLRREALLVPSPFSAASFKEAPLASPDDGLSGRVKGLPGSLPPSLRGRLDAPTGFGDQDRLEEWWAGYGLFDQWLLKGLLARRWERGRYLLNVLHEHEAGRTAHNGLWGTNGWLDVQFLPWDTTSLGMTVGVQHGVRELPFAASLPLTELERLATHAALTGGFKLTPEWRTDVTVTWQTTRFTKEASEDFLTEAKWTSDFSLEGLDHHQWKTVAAIRNDSPFGTFVSLVVEDHIRDGLWTWEVGARVDGSFIGAVLRSFYTVAPQATVFVKYEPRQEYPTMRQLAFAPYGGVPTGLRPTRIPFALAAGSEVVWAKGLTMKAEVGFEQTEQWLAWEDTDANRVFETVFVPSVNWWRPRLTWDWALQPSWTLRMDGRAAFASNASAGFAAIPHAPEIVVAGQAVHSADGYRMEAELSWVGARQGNRTATAPLDAYVSSRVTGEWALDAEWWVWMRWDNLLNGRYQERVGYDELPLRGMVGIKGRW